MSRWRCVGRAVRSWWTGELEKMWEARTQWRRDAARLADYDRRQFEVARALDDEMENRIPPESVLDLVMHEGQVIARWRDTPPDAHGYESIPYDPDEGPDIDFTGTVPVYVVTVVRQDRLTGCVPLRPESKPYERVRCRPHIEIRFWKLTAGEPEHLCPRRFEIFGPYDPDFEYLRRR